MMTGAAALAWALAFSTGAHAQTEAPADTADAAPQEEAEIVVTGIRQSLADAQSVKRNSAQVVDAISAEDIGKFPDKNIGEALQRVTGVQITRAAGEGQSVSIRGADPSLNRVEINGQTALSTVVGSGRAVEFRDLPVEFVSRVEVVKSATADMVEGGLGGTVRVITRRPFDSKVPYIAGSVQGIYGTLAKKFDPKLALIGSTLFNNDTMGILVSATYENRSLWYDQLRTTGWRQIDRDPATAGVQALDLNNDGIGDFYPDIPRPVINRESTKRGAVSGVFEWRPDSDFRAFLEGTYTKSRMTLDSQFLQLNTVQNVVDGGVDRTRTTIGPDNTATSVTFIGSLAAPGGLGVSYRNILGTQDRNTFNGQTGFDWTIGRLTLQARGGYAKSRAYNNEINATAGALGISSLTIDYDNDQQAPNITLPFDQTTTAGLNQLIVLRRPRYNDQTEYDGRLDAEFKPEGGFFTSLKAGIQKRVLTADSRFYDKSITLNGYNGQTITNSYATGVSANQTVSTVPAAQLTQQIRDLVGANAGLGDHDFFGNGNLGYDGGIRRWLNLGMDVANAVGIPDPFTNSVPLDTWEVKDDNLAGYGQAAFAIEGGVRITGVIGARVVHTRTTSDGFQVRAGVVSPVSFQGKYTEFLPSLNLKAELIPNKLQLRGTATEVLARPSPAQLAPRFALDAVGLTGSRGNPGLEPYRARQYDLGLEFYPTRTGYVSATYFRKEIGSFIQNGSEAYVEPTTGVTYNVVVPVNGNSKVTINGAEVGGQYVLDFLPGALGNLGVIANYTYSKDSGYADRDAFTGGALSFPGLSTHSYNLSGFYEDDTFNARLSYNWRSKYLITSRGRGNNPEFGEAFGQLDASAGVNLNKNVSLFFEGVNLTNAVRAENANSIYRRTIIETYGRRFYGGVRARF
ncbi:TonB-dependent receptor [Sphingomonas sp. HF-S4]|uniref:TonB-dependent receptor n=1 Tax=Sphingomonas agrestis TaxID=3080540 RepID=A0ABU3Y2Y9_9SPHN|nr:TonB-dependent receptor [Sphingomonas sp. HF-S4]MDV3455755.1 TonB-dependent receptor [Sphingomonas sp. HF-S4]